MAHRSGGPDGGKKSPNWVRIGFWIIVAVLIASIVAAIAFGLNVTPPTK
jgi:hypothetical protein